MSLSRLIHRRGWQLFNGDSFSLLPHLPDRSVDSMITDPPAGIAFMGKKWDVDRGGRDFWVEWLTKIMAECYRLLKPGAHGLVWALPRTSGWTHRALEDAGFEVRDIVTHIFGTGFPKNLDLGEGLGTALKPACEFWILVRRPPAGTIKQTVIDWGTGGLNIDACRIGGDDGRWPSHLILSHNHDCLYSYHKTTVGTPRLFGPPGYKVLREGWSWSCSDGCPVALIDAQSGTSVSYKCEPRSAASGNGTWGMTRTGAEYNDAGGVSRFFYTAKPTRDERDLGCSHLPRQSGGELTNRKEGTAGLANPRAGAGRTSGGHNLHPTTKSIGLMRYLCRLITPFGGLVLDPFSGSGSTGCGALVEGYRFQGIELDSGYARVAQARIGYTACHTEEVDDLTTCPS